MAFNPSEKPVQREPFSPLYGGWDQASESSMNLLVVIRLRDIELRSAQGVTLQDTFFLFVLHPRGRARGNWDFPKQKVSDMQLVPVR